MIIGILGGGQLGMMLAEAAAALAHETIALDHNPDACIARHADLRVAGFDDPDAADRLAADADVATYEFERIPVPTVERIAQRIPVRPGAESIRVSADRIAEKRRLREVGFRTADFEPIGSLDDLHAALDRLGRPAILKTRTGGYDGKGQAVIRDGDTAADAWRAIGDRPAILEATVPFDRELSIICVRALDGDMAFYPLVENVHHGGILRTSRAPAPGVDPAREFAIQQDARRLAESLGHVGVLTIELFDAAGDLLANEVAPRVHNSGHWTIEGAVTSQFENHILAITGAPLGPTAMRGHAAMVNLIGAIPVAVRALDLPNATLHDYGKEPRPGRKLGHITIVDDAPDRVEDSVRHITKLIDPPI